MRTILRVARHPAGAGRDDGEGQLAQGLLQQETSALPLEVNLNQTMSLSVGEKLGPYEILGPLGAGGMGEVWRARDTRIDRIVAIKVCQGKFTERFEQEARAIAGLNHPNICQLYDVGPNYLVMEFIAGSPVARADGTRQLLDLAVQIADGLAAAHAAGIVHRDLKPDNILITADRRVKILDFGLAKSVAARAAADTTITMAITDPGTTVGTVKYMSPEQARGEPNLTPQSDQFSFGLVLYELAAGRRAFQRDSAAETMAAIIRDDADPLPASIPSPLRWVIERLMSKDPADRYDSTRDLYRELKHIRERLSQASGSEAAVQAKRKTRILPVIVSGGLSLLLGAALILWLLPPPPPDISSYKFTPISRQDAAERDPEWSPDSKSIAFTTDIHGISQVFTKALDSPQAAQITHSTISCAGPFWARDGSTIYYRAGTGLRSVPASGGNSTLVLDRASNVDLHRDGDTIAFTRDGRLFIGSLKGGDPKPIDAPPFPNTQVGSGNFSPDGTKLLVGVGGASPASAALWLLPFPSGTPRKLDTPASGVEWFPDSVHVLTFHYSGRNSMTLMRLNVLNLKSEVFLNSPTVMSQASISPDGKRMAYETGQVEWDVLEISVPSGAVQTNLSGSGVVSLWPDWAPSGSHYLVETDRSGTVAIEDISTAEGFSRRLAALGSGEAEVTEPRYAPDGSRFTYFARGYGGSQLMLANAGGGAASVVDRLGVAGTSAWSPDSQWIAYFRKEGPNLQLLKISPGASISPVTIATLEQKGRPDWMNNFLIQWSPDNDWIAYPSSEGIMLISPDGKSRRKLTARMLQIFGFSKDGRQLFGIVRNTNGNVPDWQLYSVDVKTGADKFLAPVDLPASADAIAGFSMHPDGKRFLTSIAKFPFDIWMMEGFDQRKTRLEALFHR
jgi:serine/threonine protein kinase